MSDYFQRKEVSNSDLLSLRRAFFGMRDPSEDMAEVFNFGNLVDAMLTEPWRLGDSHYGDFTLNLDNEMIAFQYSDWKLAESMAAQAALDPVVRHFIKAGSHQHVFTGSLTFEYENDPYTIEGRCKFDTINLDISTGADYKTTGCTTRKACLASIDHFGYDQATAWYMDLAGIDRHWLIFISKKTKEVFKFAIERGDETYLRGLNKYSYWAHKWLMLIDQFPRELSLR